MIGRYTYNQITWIDLLNPTTEEIREVLAECSIKPDLGSDLTSMTPRSEVITSGGVMKLTLDFPIVKRTDINHPHEIKFLATKTHLVTIHFEEIEALHRFSKEFEVSSTLTKSTKKATGGQLCLTLLLALYKNMTSKLDYLEQLMYDIEEEIFAEHEREMVVEISKLKRKLLIFRQTLFAHKLVLDELKVVVPDLFTKKLAERICEIEHEYQHQLHRVEILLSTTEELRNTNDSLLTSKQNEIMKIFTILAFITFPLTLFTSMFGMNTISTPIIGEPGDFWIILWTMAVVSVSFFMFFKYKKWI